MKNVIETNHLSRRFKILEAVHDLNLVVPSGSVYAFLGRNGAGKTTTIHLLAGLIEPTSGNSFIFGQPSRNLQPEHWQQIGYVSENQKLYDWLTGEELMAFTARLYPNWDFQFADFLIKKLSLPMSRKVQNYSRGERAKIALLLALAYRPKLLILDEPFGGLDALVREEFLSSILELTHQNEWTIFFSSHDIDDVEKLSDHVGIIERGRLQLSEPIEKLQLRFRQIEIQSEQDLLNGERSNVIGLEKGSNRLRFIHTKFSEEAEASLRAKYPQVRMDVSTLSLREIFVALAKTY
jgi:ABC-2 type transport system ATP-binding protein